MIIDFQYYLPGLLVVAFSLASLHIWHENDLRKTAKAIAAIGVPLGIFSALIVGLLPRASRTASPVSSGRYAASDL